MKHTLWWRSGMRRGSRFLIKRRLLTVVGAWARRYRPLSAGWRKEIRFGRRPKRRRYGERMA